ncbi:MAG: EamA family transporter, partial [Oscillospiraceae bacterium]|nr:EamA family transporter [Oscillospiraceae bacterium]
SIIQLLSAPAALLPYLLLTRPALALPLSPLASLMLVIVGLVHTGLAYALYFGSMDGLQAQTVALFSYLDPITALLLSALALGPGHARFIWCDCAIGILCGATVNKALGRTFHGYLLCAAGSLGALEGLELLLRLFFDDQEAGPVLATAGGELAYSILFAPVIYLLFWGIYRRFRSDLEF